MAEYTSKYTGAEIDAGIEKALAGGMVGPPGPAGTPGKDGAPGPKGDPGAGFPAGGTAGQVLRKVSDVDYAAERATPAKSEAEVPAGGMTGQLLAKESDEDYAAHWVDPPATGVTSFNGRTGAVTPQSGDYTAAQVGARPSTWTPTAGDIGAVPTTRKINQKPLSADVALTAGDVGALASDTVTYGTSDLASGASLTTGHIYLMYS